MIKRICFAFYGFVLSCFIGASFSLAAPSYYQDIWPIVERKCLSCHSENGVAFSFENAETAFDFRVAMAAAVSEGRMPPWVA